MIETLLTILYFVVVGLTVYLSIEIYKQYFATDDEEKDGEGEDDNNTEKDEPDMNDFVDEHRKLVDRVNMNTQMNRSIYNYLESNRAEDLRDAAALQENTESIQRNTVRVTELMRAKSEHKATLKAVREDIASLRTAMSYDVDRIIKKFVREYESKYDLSYAHKQLLQRSKLLGMLDPLVSRAFSSIPPDLFLAEHHTEAAELVRVLLTEFEIGKYYPAAAEHNQTLYGSEIPVVARHLSLHANTIDLNDKAEFLVTSYLPRLIAYIDNNINTLIDEVDDAMDEYYSKYPFVRYFDEFLTRLYVDDVLADETHMFTMMAKHSMRMFYTEEDLTWFTFKGKIREYFTSAELALLVVVLPEFLLMIKYATEYLNYKKDLPFTPFIKRYLLTSRKTLGASNLENYHSLVRLFRCSQDNALNKTLRQLLREDKHMQTFKDVFLANYNSLVNTSADVGQTLELSFFTCDGNNEESDDDDADDAEAEESGPVVDEESFV